MSDKPLMPKATAVWLIDNSSLTFEQIADFCGLHVLEVKSIADGDSASSIVGQDPIMTGELTLEEIRRCEAAAHTRLQFSEKRKHFAEVTKKKKSRYTPVARRHDKPDAIAFLLKHYPNITDAQVVRLIGTTKSTIAAIRTRSHWNMANIRPHDPVLLGLCTQTELDRLALAHRQPTVDTPEQ